MNDLISRRAAIDAIKALWDGAPTAQHVSAMFDCEDAIQALPSAQPKHGRWVDKYGDGDWHCTCCGAIVEKHEQNYKNWYFCYHCGARMDEVE